MQEQKIQKILKRKRASSSYQLILDYQNYLNQKRLATNQKIAFFYNDIQLAFTPKQIEVLKLVAKGFSNAKIAKRLSAKEATTKLLIYRIMRYMEGVLFESVDRFYLVIIAQKLKLEYPPFIVSKNGDDLQITTSRG